MTDVVADIPPLQRLRAKLEAARQARASGAQTETTSVPPDRETEFRDWVQRNNIHDLDHPDSHYDYRGAFLGGAKPDARGHWPDPWKQHGHESFSVESRYSSGPGDGGTWNGEQFTPPDRLAQRLQQLRDMRAGRVSAAAAQVTPSAVRAPAEATGAVPTTLEQQATRVAEDEHQQQLEHLSPGTRALGFGLGAARGTVGALTYLPALAVTAAKETFAPLTPEEAAHPATQAAATRYGPAAVERVRAQAAVPTAPGPAAPSPTAAALNPLPLLDRMVRGFLDRDPEVMGELAGFVAAGHMAAVEALRKGKIGGRPKPPDAFETLGLDPRTATPEAVDLAYREAAKRTHPDVNQSPDAAAEFHRYTEARQAAQDYLEQVGRTRGGKSTTATPAPAPTPPPAEQPPADRSLAIAPDRNAMGSEARDLSLRTERTPEEDARLRGLSTSLRRSAPPPPAKPNEALHDADGNVIPGTEVTPEQRAAGPDRERVRNERILATAPRLEPNAPPPAPTSIVRIPTRQILTDPARFQFKALGTEGVGGELKGVQRFNPNLAGVVSVWQDPADGKTYVVNGHHRLDLAKRLGHPDLNVQFLKAPDATAARAQGALINIAEGRGSATDVAKFLRDTGKTPADLTTEGVSLKGDLARDGLALSRLAPDVFDQVATGKVPQGWGTAIGSLIEDPALQREALKAVRSSGRRLTQGEVTEVARQVRDAGTEAVNQETLFGKESERHGLFVEKAQLAAAIKRRLSGDRRLFGYVSKEGRADELARAGSTRVDVGAARDLAQVSARAEEIFDRLYTRAGPLADIVTKAARRTAHGEQSTSVAADIYPAIRDAVGREIAGGEGTGVQAGGSERPVPHGTRSIADEEAGTPERAGDSKDVAQEGFLGVREPLVQDDLFGKPKLAEPEQTEMLPANAGIPTAKLKDTKIGPDEIARVRREGAEPAGARPADLFAQGEKSAVARAAKQIVDAVKEALKTEGGRPVEPQPATVSADQPVGMTTGQAEPVPPTPLGKPSPLEKPGAVSQPAAQIPPGTVAPSRPYTAVGEGLSPEERAVQHAQLAYGSEAKAKAAALSVVRDAGDLAQSDLFGGTFKTPLDAAAREAAVAKAAVPRVWVPLRGQRFETPEQMHTLLWAFRSPLVERLHFILLADGKIVGHSMHSSGVINSVRMHRSFVDDLAADAKALGATDVVLAHNHPSGDPTPSDEDKAFTGRTGRDLDKHGIRLRGHYIIDDTAGTYIEHHGDSYSLHDVSVPRASDVADWTATHGALIAAMPSGVIALASTRALPTDRIDVLYLNAQGYPVALEPHGLDALDRTRVWLPERLKALAATHAVIVTGDASVYQKALDAARSIEGVADVLHLWKEPTEGPHAIRWRSALSEGRAPSYTTGTAALSARRIFEPDVHAGPDVLGAHPSAGRYDALSPVRPRAVAEGDVRDAVRKLFNPTARTPSGAQAARIVRAEKGLEARANEVAQAALAPFHHVDLSTPEGVQFAEAMEPEQPGRVRPTIPAKLRPTADAFRQALDEARARVQALGTGKLEHFIAEYLPHIWEDPIAAKSAIGRILGKRPLEGPKSFLKKRTIPTIADGLKAGLKPVTNDLADMVLLKLREMNRYIAGQQIIAEYRKQNLVQFVRAGRAKPDGWAWIDDPIGTVHGPFTDEGAATVRGRYAATEPVATILNQHLSPGLRGNAIFDAYMGLGNTINQVQLGLSAFHLGFVSVDAITSQLALGIEQLLRGNPFRAIGNATTMWAAPFTTLVRGNKVINEYLHPGTVGGDLAKIADAVTAAGGRVRMDTFYKNNALAAFAKAMREHPIKTVAKGLAGGAIGGVVGGPAGAMIGAGFASKLLPAVMEFTAKPLMEYFVPRMKMGVFADLARYELSKMAPDASPDEVRAVMAKVWDSVDNRMGQLVYDNLFWHRATKDVLMASTRSLGWNLGTARELGGGASDFLHGKFSHRVAYLFALPFAVGILGSVVCYLYTGHGPRDLHDIYQPPTGRRDADGNEQRVQLPSYMKDVLGFARHPVTTVEHKLHPLLGVVAQLLENENFYGGEIRNPHDPVMVQVQQVADYLISQLTPIGVQNAAEQKRRGQSGDTQILPFVGITPAPRESVRSKAQNLMADYLKSAQPSGATPEQSAQRRLRAEVADAYRAHQLTYLEATRRLRAAGFSHEQVADAMRRMQENPLVSRFKQLTLEQAREVYAAGTPREKDLWGPTLFRKEAGGRIRHVPGSPTPPRRHR